MRRRQISPEERALWDHVVRGAEPLHRPLRQDPPAPTPAPPPVSERRNPPPPPPLQPFRMGERADHRHGGDLISGLLDSRVRLPLRMDARLHGRMKRGRVEPEARIDLHGMTLAQAHGALIRFVLASQPQGRRLVLVITGKGRPRSGDAATPPGRGLLREQVPEWLMLPPLSALVLEVAQAHQSHGGGGALYVYLRR